MDSWSFLPRDCVDAEIFYEICDVTNHYKDNYSGFRCPQAKPFTWGHVKVLRKWCCVFAVFLTHWQVMVMLMFHHVLRVSNEDEGWWWRAIRLYQEICGCQELLSQYWRTCGERWHAGVIVFLGIKLWYYFHTRPLPVQVFLSLLLPPHHVLRSAIILLLILFLPIILRSSGNLGRHPR